MFKFRLCLIWNQTAVCEMFKVINVIIIITIMFSNTKGSGFLKPSVQEIAKHLDFFHNTAKKYLKNNIVLTLRRLYFHDVY